MTAYLLTILAALAGVVIGLIQELRLRSATKRADAAEALAHANADKATVAQIKLGRLENVTATKDRELARMEDDLATLTPDASAAVAGRLLDDAWDGDHPTRKPVSG